MEKLQKLIFKFNIFFYYFRLTATPSTEAFCIFVIFKMSLSLVPTHTSFQGDLEKLRPQIVLASNIEQLIAACMDVEKYAGFDVGLWKKFGVLSGATNGLTPRQNIVKSAKDTYESLTAPHELDEVILEYLNGTKTLEKKKTYFLAKVNTIITCANASFLAAQAIIDKKQPVTLEFIKQKKLEAKKNKKCKFGKNCKNPECGYCHICRFLGECNKGNSCKYCHSEAEDAQFSETRKKLPPMLRLTAPVAVATVVVAPSPAGKFNAATDCTRGPSCNTGGCARNHNWIA